MDFVYIDHNLWKALADQARQEYPHECIGYFEAIKVLPGSLRITNINPCVNIVRGNARKTKSQMSKKDHRQLISCIRRHKDNIYGVYHSHPQSGVVWLGEADSYLGKHAKRYSNQIIIGVINKGRRTKKAYWQLESGIWTRAEFIVK